MGIAALAFGLLTGTFGGLVAGTMFQVSVWAILTGLVAWQVTVATILIAGAGKVPHAPTTPRLTGRPGAGATVTPLQAGPHGTHSGQRAATHTNSRHGTRRQDR